MWIEKHYKLVIVALLAIFLVLTISSIWPDRKSPTCDELSHHITTGYVYWTKGDFAFATAAPPLARLMISAPLLLMDINLPDDRNYWARENRGEFSYEFMYNLNKSLVNDIIFYARVPVIFTCLFGGIVLFFWSRKMFGGMTAILALMFYSFSPNVLAHSRLATCDAIAMVFIMISVFSFWDFLRSPGYKSILFSGVCLGFALMAKYSALLLMPIYLMVTVVWFYKNHSERPGHIIRMFLCFTAVAFIVLWAGYGFEFRPFLQNVMRAEAKEAMFDRFAEKFLLIFGDQFINEYKNALYTKPVPLSSFILGVLGVLRHGASGVGTYFVGQLRDGGHRLYYVVACLIKTPIPIIVSFFTGIIMTFRNGKHKALIRYLLLFMVVFFLSASKAKLQLGLRYVLPIYPFVFIIAAWGLKSLLTKNRWTNIIGLILISWLCISSVLIWPDYLSYFNEFVGGSRNGHKYLRDSNIDWGQDLPALGAYFKENDLDEIYLNYFGSADPGFYGIIYKNIPEGMRDEPGNGVYAISVNNIDSLRWAKEMPPTAKAGRSIYIYDLRSKEKKD